MSLTLCEAEHLQNTKVNTEKNNLRIWQGKYSTENSNQLLKVGLADLLVESEKKYSSLPFLIVHSASGKTDRFTYSSFFEHVQSVLDSWENQDAHLPVSCEGNRWEHLAFLIAGLIKWGNIAILSPVDPQALREKKLSSLPNAKLYTSEEINSRIGKPRKFIPQNVSKSADLSPAIYVFTSGSTGQSKVVQQTHRGIISNWLALKSLHSLGTATTIATPLPVFHVNALEFSFLSTLLSGGQLILHEKFLPHVLRSSLQTDKIDILSITPPLLRALCRFDFPKNTFRTLRYIVSAASPISAELAQLCREKIPTRIIQGYGLSEAVNFSCLIPPNLDNKVYTEVFFAEPRPSIGSAVEGNTISVYDERGVECGPEVVGELCIQGDTVMIGYLATDSQPFFMNSLRTGDLGFYRIASNNERFYFITGRSKDSCKVNGHTIGLVDIDEALAAFFSCADTIAFTAQHNELGEEIIIAIQNSIYTSDKLIGLRDTLLAIMPPDTLPRNIFITDEPVRNASGKPQRWQIAKKFTYAKENNEKHGWAVFS